MPYQPRSAIPGHRSRPSRISSPAAYASDLVAADPVASGGHGGAHARVPAKYLVQRIPGGATGLQDQVPVQVHSRGDGCRRVGRTPRRSTCPRPERYWRTYARGLKGSTYLERGRPVLVLAKWSRTTAGPDCVSWLSPPKGAPRNVLVVREDGGACRAAVPWAASSPRKLTAQLSEQAPVIVAGACSLAVTSRYSVNCCPWLSRNPLLYFLLSVIPLFCNSILACWLSFLCSG